MPGRKSDIIRSADKEAKNILQRNIRLIRKKSGLTQQEVADALQIKRETYGNYEVRTLPPQYLIFRLSKIYNITPDVFYKVESDELLSAHSSTEGDYSFTDLTDHERMMLLQYRQLKKSDREKISNLIKETLNKTE